MNKVFYGFYVRDNKDEVIYNEYGYQSIADLDNAIELSPVKGTINKYTYFDKEDPQVEYVLDGPDKE